MRGRKMLAVGICGMVGLGMAQGVSAANSSENPVPVTYDYSGTAEPVSPNYGVNIPTGLVFTASNTTDPLDISVEMVKAPGQSDIVGACKATVAVKSTNGYEVRLDTGAGGIADAVKYTVKYGEGEALTGTESKVIGTLSKGVTDETPNTKIVGSAQLNGVATKTGAHTDTLTYTITNVAVPQS